MFHLFICGSGRSVEEEEEVEEVMCTSSQRVSRRKSSKYKNPYSTRGLDKFASVLAHLEEKKHTICRQTAGSPDMLLVRFRCSESKDWLPIVVKLGGRKRDDQPKPAIASVGADYKPDEALRGRQGRLGPSSDCRPETMMRLILVAVVVLVLVVLCLVRRGGRSFGVMCACILWYLVPLMTDQRGRQRKAKCKSIIRL